MSNIGNIFGNEGWIQSSIDRSRGKTRPGDRARKASASDQATRKQLLASDPLYIKNTTGGKPATRAVKSKQGILGALVKKLKG
jgi:hypothetical protein